MNHDYDAQSPPRTLREVLGRATLVTGLAALAVWLIAAVYAGFVIATVADEGAEASLSFAVVEMGAALIALGALGVFATLSAFLVTHAVRAVKPRTEQPAPPAETDAESEHEAE